MNARWPRLLLLFVLLAGIGALIVWHDRLNVEQVRAWMTNAGPAAPALFIVVYAIATVFMIPGSALTLAGGALFGPLLGAACNLGGASLGAGLAFLVARYLGADWVERKTRGGRLQRLREGVEAEGWRFVAFTRLVPLFPFVLLNYAFGLTRIRFWHYLLATAICMLPAAFAFTYLGYAGREALAGGEDLIRKGLLALALLAGVAFIPRLVARWKAAWTKKNR